MSELLERPVLVGLMGSVIAILACYFWLQTGHKRLLQLSIGALLLTLLGVTIERLVVTDREAVKATLHEIAQLIEQNEFESALSYLHSSAEQTKQRARRQVEGYSFKRAEIKHNLEIYVDSSQEPKVAEASFNFVVEVDAAPGTLRQSRGAGFLRVTLQQEAGQWRVTDFQDPESPTRGFQRRGAS